MTDSQFPDNILSETLALAKRAGEEIMHIYAQDFSVSDKADRSPLTAADLASHQILCAGLAELTPAIPVLSEESAQIDYAERARWERYWLIDPLDGTKEFIKRNGEFTVNIALIEDHRAVLGVVLIPARQHCYYATLPGGAFRQEADHSPIPIKVTRPATQPLRVVGSRSHANPALNDYVTQLDKHVGEHIFVPVGSALKFCLVAEGSADIYPRLGPTSEWDTAAAQCVVEAAGGQVLRLDGTALRYNTKKSLLNPHFLVFGDANRDWLSYLS